jgi:hypothetical protein
MLLVPPAVSIALGRHVPRFLERLMNGIAIGGQSTQTTAIDRINANTKIAQQM